MRRVDLFRAHGTKRCYDKQKCRCALCAMASREYGRLNREAYPINPERTQERREYHRLWRAAHPDKDAEYRRRAFEADPERSRDACRAWRAKNVQGERDRGRAYYWAHTEEIAERDRLYREANRDKVAEYQRRYRADHLADFAARESNRRARKAGNGGEYTAADVQAQYDRQRGKCYWRNASPDCAVDLKDGYHVDHVMPVALGGSNDPSNLVVACPHCNQSKNARHPMDFAGMML